MSNEIEDRVQILEEKFEYQDYTVETLNQVIIDQQKQIDNLQEELIKLRETVTAANTEKEKGSDPPPPHY